MNTENNQQIPVSKQPHQEGEIDLRELFSIIWKGKWIIITITFVFALVSVGIALYLPNEYKATAVVQPNDSGGGGKLASLAGELGGLASLAGINLGAGESSGAVIALEVMKSWGFAEDFIGNHELAVPLFAAEGWDESSNTLILNSNVYDENSNKWMRVSEGKSIKAPSSWELYKVFQSRVFIDENQETGLIKISVLHYSPNLAKSWVDLLIRDINQHMKNRALKEANESIKYLEEQISQTSVAEIRHVFSELIQEQHKTRMLAQVSDEYIFKTISSAKVPEEKEKPKRALIAVLGTLLGGILSVTLVLFFGFLRKS